MISSAISGVSDNRLPSGLHHSDILKVIMLYCSSFTFDRNYEHVDAHQDDGKAYGSLSRQSQLCYGHESESDDLVTSAQGAVVRVTATPRTCDSVHW